MYVKIKLRLEWIKRSHPFNPVVEQSICAMAKRSEPSVVLILIEQFTAEAAGLEIPYR
jgi:hypothetical protein